MSDDKKLTGRGGPGRGQGRKPIFDEAMDKVALKLPPNLYAYLGDDKSQGLRALLEWAMEQETLAEDPGPVTEFERSSYTLADRHLEMAVALGDGVRIAGIRRAIQSAMDAGLNPDAIDAG